MVKLIRGPQKFGSSHVILSVCAIALLGYTGTVLLQAFASNPAEVSAPPAKRIAADASSSCCRMRVNSVTRPDPAGSRLTVNVTTENLTGATLQISPGLQMHLRDSSGALHPFTAAYLPAGVTVGGPLSPGTSRTENLDFDVPTNAIPEALVLELNAAATPLTVGMP